MTTNAIQDYLESLESDYDEYVVDKDYVVSDISNESSNGEESDNSEKQADSSGSAVQQAGPSDSAIQQPGPSGAAVLRGRLTQTRRTAKKVVRRKKNAELRVYVDPPDQQNTALTDRDSGKFIFFCFVLQYRVGLE